MKATSEKPGEYLVTVLLDGEELNTYDFHTPEQRDKFIRTMSGADDDLEFKKLPKATKAA